MLKRVRKAIGEAVYLCIRIPFVGGNTGEDIAAHLGATFDNGPEIHLGAVAAADEVCHGHADGDGAVTVTEVPVIVHLKEGAHGMVFDSKGIDNGLGSLNLLAEVFIKAVLVDAFSGDGTAEATQTAAVEGVLSEIDDPGFSGELCPEAADHGLQLGIILLAVGKDHHITLF